ncbi:MAG: zf-HC2 domain-containing protein [Myxococcota bacterium]
MTQTDPPTTAEHSSDDGQTLIEETFSAYIDGELEEAEREAFEAQLAEDAELRSEFEEFRETIHALRSIHAVAVEEPPQLDPDAFARKLEGTIRNRSRGRFFHDDFFYRARIPYEVFAVIMLAVIAALLYTMRPLSPDHDPDLAPPPTDAMGGSPEHRRDNPTPDSSEQPKPDKATTDGSQPLPPDDSTPDHDTPKGPTPDTTPPPSGNEDTTQDNNTDNTVGTTARTTNATVKTMRTEMMVYTISLRDPNPTQRAKALTRQIRATSRQFTVSQASLKGGGRKLTVRMDKRQLKSFLQTFAKLGQTRAVRTYIESKDATPQATVSFRIESLGARRPYTPPKIP